MSWIERGNGYPILNQGYGNVTCPWCGKVVRKYCKAQKICGAIACDTKQRNAAARRRNRGKYSLDAPPFDSPELSG